LATTAIQVQPPQQQSNSNEMLTGADESKSSIEQERQQEVNCSNSNEHINQVQREEESNSSIEHLLQPLQTLQAQSNDERSFSPPSKAAQIILCLGMVYTHSFIGNDLGQQDRDRTRCLGIFLVCILLCS